LGKSGSVTRISKADRPIPNKKQSPSLTTKGDSNSSSLSKTPSARTNAIGGKDGNKKEEEWDYPEDTSFIGKLKGLTVSRHIYFYDLKSYNISIFLEQREYKDADYQSNRSQRD
jgi:hypothetical protein